MKRIIGGIASALLLLTGCAGGTGFSSTSDLDSKREDIEPVTSEQVEEKEKEVIWVVEPSLDFDYVSEILEDQFAMELSGIDQEQKGYSTEMEPNTSFRKDVIAVCKDKIYGIYDFEGNKLFDLTIPAMDQRWSGTYDTNPISYDGEAMRADLSDSYGVFNDDLTEFKTVNMKQEGDAFPASRKTVEYRDGKTILKQYNERYELVETEEKIVSDGYSVIPVGEEDISFVAINPDGDFAYNLNNLLWGYGRTRFFNGFLTAVKKLDPILDNGLMPYKNSYWQLTHKGSAPNHFKLAYINGETGEPLTDFIYDYTRFFNSGYAPVMKDGKWGYIDETGKEVTEFIFDDASVPYEGKVYVAVNGFYGILDLGKTLADGIEVNAETCGVSDRPVNEDFRSVKQGEIYGGLQIDRSATIYSGPSEDLVIREPGNPDGYAVLYDVFEIVDGGDFSWYRFGYTDENANEWCRSDDHVIFTDGY